MDGTSERDLRSSAAEPIPSTPDGPSPTARDGPPSAFGDALISHINPLRAFAISLCRSEPNADDLVQETLMRALSNSKQFRVETNMRAWLMTILRNTFYSNYRRHRREVPDVDGVYALRLAVSGTQESNLDLLDFRKALATLPVSQREALMLVGAIGHSYQEAAAICEVQIGTVKSRVSRARSTLVELLAL
jgi:RNA polymerase sigma-70 factor (ECF subfamily)